MLSHTLTAKASFLHFLKSAKSALFGRRGKGIFFENPPKILRIFAKPPFLGGFWGLSPLPGQKSARVRAKKYVGECAICAGGGDIGLKSVFLHVDFGVISVHRGLRYPFLVYIDVLLVVDSTADFLARSPSAS